MFKAFTDLVYVKHFKRQQEVVGNAVFSCLLLSLWSNGQCQLTVTFGALLMVSEVTAAGQKIAWQSLSNIRNKKSDI